MGAILVIILILLIIGVFPREGGYSAGYGYAPLGGLGLILVIIIIVILLGHIPIGW